MPFGADISRGVDLRVLCCFYLVGFSFIPVFFFFLFLVHGFSVCVCVCVLFLFVSVSEYVRVASGCSCMRACVCASPERVQSPLRISLLAYSASTALSRAEQQGAITVL